MWRAAATTGLIGTVLLALAGAAHAYDCRVGTCATQEQTDEWIRALRQQEIEKAEKERQYIENYRRQNQPKPQTADHSFYLKLANNSAGYVGKTFAFSGKIIQSVQVSNGYTLRVNVTPGSYDLWTDTIWVDVPSTASLQASLSEGAVVEFNSRFLGMKTYTAVMGQTVQLPHMTACEVRQSKRGVITAPRSC